MHYAAAEDMYVQMKNRLAGARAGINHRAITAVAKSRIVSQPGADPQEVTEQRFISLRSFIKRFNMTERNHEHVSGRLWVNILNGDAAIILMHELRRNCAGDDFAEETVVIGHD